MLKKSTKSRQLMLAAIFFQVLLAVGCSSVPKPIGEMASANTAISGAETSNATKFAPVEMDRAKNKIEQANTAVNKQNNAEATRYANESLADANLAKAKADASKAHIAATEMEKSINLLRQSLNLK